jgi:hypothetical protein
VSEQILNQILDELRSLNMRMNALDADVKEIKINTQDIPSIKQAVLETLEISKRNESSQTSFERKAAADLNTHGHSIDILNRRQLRLEADIEKLKNR